MLGAVFACFFFWIFQETGEIDIQKVPFKDRITIEAMQKYLQTLGDTKGLDLLWIRLVGDTLYLICLFVSPWIREGVKKGWFFPTVRSRRVVSSYKFGSNC